MTEALKHAQDAVLPHLEPTEVAEPGEGALDFPAPPIPPQLAAVLVRLLSFIPAGGDHQLDGARRRVGPAGPAGPARPAAGPRALPSVAAAASRSPGWDTAAAGRAIWHRFAAPRECLLHTPDCPPPVVLAALCAGTPAINSQSLPTVARCV